MIVINKLLDLGWLCFLVPMVSPDVHQAGPDIYAGFSCSSLANARSFAAFKKDRLALKGLF